MTKHGLHRTISPAERGQIIQRVIVDGWTSSDLAASSGLPERLVDLWVEDFRRNGMASLREEPAQSFGAELFQLAIWRPVRTNLRKIAVGLRRFLTADSQVKPLPLRGLRRDGPL
jgi:transposase-like protein